MSDHKEYEREVCAMCGKSTRVYYITDGIRIYVCFEHCEDGTFADWLIEHDFDSMPMPWW
jgi:hypothetical protein